MLDIPYLAPGNAVEAALAEAFKQALDIAPIGVLDDFFDLGGDSLAEDGAEATGEASDEEEEDSGHRQCARPRATINAAPATIIAEPNSRRRMLRSLKY